jgi:hypothetical protein
MNNAENAYRLRQIASMLADMGTDEATVADLMHDSYNERKGF